MKIKYALPLYLRNYKYYTMSCCTEEERVNIEKRLTSIERRLMFLEDRIAQHEKQSFCAGISDK